MMRLLKWMTTAAVFAMAFWMIQRHAIDPYRANLRKAPLKARTKAAWRLHEQGQQVAEAARQTLAEVEPLIRMSPWDADLHLVRAVNLNFLGRHAESIDAYRMAALSLPSPEIFLELGEKQLLVGRRAEGMESLRKAMEYQPGVAGIVQQIQQSVAPP